MQSRTLWFDVETKQETTGTPLGVTLVQLWFDVETKQETTDPLISYISDELWFDVETKQETTANSAAPAPQSCGLM